MSDNYRGGITRTLHSPSAYHKNIRKNSPPRLTISAMEPPRSPCVHWDRLQQGVFISQKNPKDTHKTIQILLYVSNKKYVQRHFYLSRNYYFLNPIPKSQRISASTSAKSSAGIYPVTVNPSTSLSVRMTIRPLIRNEISQSVRKFRGAVRRRATEPIRRFTSARTIATISDVVKPSTWTPGTRRVAR